MSSDHRASPVSVDQKPKVVTYNVLGLDPGYVNFGWAVLVIQETQSPSTHGASTHGASTHGASTHGASTLVVHVRAIGRLQKTLTDLKQNLKPQIARFTGEVEGLLSRHKVHGIMLERYQSRGLKGVTIEYINMMLGSLLYMSHTHKVYCKALTAVSWKNTAKKSGIDLPLLYKQLRHGLSPHEIDACCIAWFGFLAYRGNSAGQQLNHQAVKSLLDGFIENRKS